MLIVICSEGFGIDSDPILFDQNTLEIKIRIHEQLYQGSKLPLHLRRDLFAQGKELSQDETYGIIRTPFMGY